MYAHLITDMLSCGFLALDAVLPAASGLLENALPVTG
jgi:hypothetical protein